VIGKKPIRDRQFDLRRSYPVSPPRVLSFGAAFLFLCTGLTSCGDAQRQPARNEQGRGGVPAAGGQVAGQSAGGTRAGTPGTGGAADPFGRDAGQGGQDFSEGGASGTEPGKPSGGEAGYERASAGGSNAGGGAVGEGGCPLVRGTFDIDIPVVTVSGTVTLNGAPPPSDATSVIRLVSPQSDEFDLATVADGNYSAEIVPGKYDVVYVFRPR
jgi:hypothetical protein